MANIKLMTAPKFAAYAGLPYKIVSIMLKQGELPFIKPQRRIYIPVDDAIETIRNNARDQAEQINMQRPVGIVLSNSHGQHRRQKKNSGRLPDKVKARLQEEHKNLEGR